MNLEGILARVRPTPAQEAALAQDVDDLLFVAGAAMERLGLTGEPSVQGSVAKGTWLRGEADIDLFLLLDPGLDEARLKAAAEALGAHLLEGPRRRYAQHPYVVGTFRGRTVDLVPAYRVAAAHERMSAVDRTPFHTEWVRRHLDDAGCSQVRLLKRWMKGTEVYGAQTAAGGFSGYLVEVLVVRFGGFAQVLAWLAAGARPRRLALGDDHVEDEVAPLVVVDPVDPARNCAAAVRDDTLARAVEAAQAWSREPAEAFFFPAPPRAEPAEALHAALRRQGAAWVGLAVAPQTDRLDIVLPQFQRSARLAAQALERAGFPVRRLDVQPYDDEARVGLQWVCDDVELPAVRVHAGPVEDAGPNAQRFRQKWQGHPLAQGPVETAPGGQLTVRVRVPQRTPFDWLRANPGVLTGRHVQEALAAAEAGAGAVGRPAGAAGSAAGTGAFLGDPAQAEGGWAPRVADVVLDRRPWQR